MKITKTYQYIEDKHALQGKKYWFFGHIARETIRTLQTEVDDLNRITSRGIHKEFLE